jgi:hypothetical protein
MGMTVYNRRLVRANEWQDSPVACDKREEIEEAEAGMFTLFRD